MKADTLKAARQADWMQVVLNQGPPCFYHLTEDRFCLRAERWFGHGPASDVDHPFVSLVDMLERYACEFAAEQLRIYGNHLHRCPKYSHFNRVCECGLDDLLAAELKG